MATDRHRDEDTVKKPAYQDSLERKNKGKTEHRFRFNNNLKVHPVSSSTSSLEKICRNTKYNASSRTHRIWLTTKILGASALAILGLLVFVIMDLTDSIDLMVKEKNMQNDVKFSIKAADVIHALQVERGLTVLSISSKGAKNITEQLSAERLNTDNVINADKVFESEFGIKRIQNHRKSIGNGENTTINEVINFYTGIIEQSLQWLFHSVTKDFLGNDLMDLVGYQMFLTAKDKTGIERALGSSYFAVGHFNTSELLSYAEQYLEGEAFLNSSLEFTPTLKKLYEQSTRQAGNIIERVKSQRLVILKNKAIPANSTAGKEWFNLMSKYLNMLLDVQKAAGSEIIASMEKRVNAKEETTIISIAVLVSVLMLMPVSVMAVVRTTNTIQEYAAKLEDITLNLKEEKTRTDNVLFAMFPRSVAETLRKGEKVDSEYFDNVTVFFSDIVNFTNICAYMSPIEVTSMLNNIYSAFDDKIDKYDVYKVETIGDAYMVASGLPIRNGGKHVDEICRMALDLVKVTNSLVLDEVSGQTLLIRVGIHTGPCVSGIVGNKMPRYCLFGDTVNTASRMQTTGEPQKIHVSENSKKALNPFKQYVLEFRGYIAVKGKGDMQTYWLQEILLP